MIPHDRIHFNDDGTAWLVEEALPDSPSGWPATRNDYPCDTCVSWGGRGMSFKNCRDCDGTGRHTFEIEVACEACGDRHDIPIGNSSGGATYRVSVVPGMVLPIHDHDNLLDGDTALDHDWQPHITVSADQALLCVRDARYTDDWDERAITLPPAAKPNMRAVKLRVEKI
jgi:hypothetical protein